MAEVLGTTAAIGNILKAILTTGTLLQAISRAPNEAQQLSNQIDATNAVLKSLKASLRAVNRPQEFFTIWTRPTRVVLRNIKTTIDELNARLGGQRSGPPRPVTLSFWSRVTWPFEREECLMLQAQLQNYLQMLSMVQNALMRGTAQEAQSSADQVDEIITQTGAFSLLSSTFSQAVAGHPGSTSLPGSIPSLDNNTIIAGDSASQVDIGIGVTRRGIASIFRRRPSTGSSSTAVYPPEPMQYTPVHTQLSIQKFVVDPKAGYAVVCLGAGRLIFHESTKDDNLWVTFQPAGIEHHESRWWISPTCIKLKSSAFQTSLLDATPDISPTAPNPYPYHLRGAVDPRASVEKLLLRGLRSKDADKLQKEMKMARKSLIAREKRAKEMRAAIESASRMKNEL